MPMTSVSVRACSRCHFKKIRCTGYPNCQNCSSANLTCVPYARPKKSETFEALTQVRKRVQWLEAEVLLHFNIDCTSLQTGTSLKPTEHGSPTVRRPEPTAPASSHGSRVDEEETESPAQGASDDSPTNNAPDICLLAFNATGEMKYLGPSSGAFFATYATGIVRSFNSDHNRRKRPFGLAANSCTSNGAISSPPEEHQPLPSHDVQILLRSYKMWVHPLHPLFDLELLDALVSTCQGYRPNAHGELERESTRYSEMTLFYLVMALGAANHENLIKQELILDTLPMTRPSPSYLYSKAMQYFDRNPRRLETNISTIQIVLLISIYSSFGPVGSSQWQLAGLAMRMAIEIGLHHAPKTLQTSAQESDRRNRVFWTAYALEISLAYNLGRPPSISEEYITSPLPNLKNDTCLAIQHIKHRQIQSRIISHVYCGTRTGAVMSTTARQGVIVKLQGELDEWRAALLCVVPRSDVESPYPFSYWDRLYHGTSFVLHRSSPLCPQPSAQSLEQCIRSAGEYINCVMEVLRNSNVPLSWMLIQGVIFAGLTMLIMARTGVSVLTRRSGLPFLLVELPSWTRKCSICLAIMNERWSEDLLSTLDTQFEALANDTLKMISSSVSTSASTSFSQREHTNITAEPDIQPQDVLPSLDQGVGQNPINPATDMDYVTIGDWEQLQFFREFIGIDGVQTFWDISPLESNINGTAPASFSEGVVDHNYSVGNSDNIFPSWS